MRTGAAVVRALGDDRVTGALISDLDEQGNLQGPTEQLPCDLLAVSGGWSPATQLHAQRQGRVAWDPDLQGFLPDGDLLVLFSDETAGVTTHPAVRSLSIQAPTAGEVTLDFNRAVNLPCAYTPYATCPYPPLENRLPIAVTAGERLPEPAELERAAG